MRDIQKVTSGKLLTKQAMRKTNFVIYKNTYIPELLHSVVTTGIEELVILGNTFLCNCVKEVCHL
jgi:hypothetical protein